MIHFDLLEKNKIIEELTKKTQQDDFWKDQNNSKKVINELNFNKKLVEKYSLLSNRISLLQEECLI